MPRGQRDELFAPPVEVWVGGDHQRTGPLLGERGEGWLQVTVDAGVLNYNLQPKRLPRDCRGRQLRLGVHTCRVHQQTHYCHPRQHFAQQLKLFSNQFARKVGNAGGVAARPIEAGNQPKLDWVDGDAEDDWNLVRCCNSSLRSRAAKGDDHGHRKAHQFGCHFGKSIVSTFRPAERDVHILALHIADLAQALAKSGQVRSGLASRRGGKKHDHRHHRLLGARRERPPGRRAAEQRYELAPFELSAHSITSSARASSVGGTSRPSAFAVLRLTTSSNFVGCSTGSSAGLAPLRILSTNVAARWKCAAWSAE